MQPVRQTGIGQVDPSLARNRNGNPLDRNLKALQHEVRRTTIAAQEGDFRERVVCSRKTASLCDHPEGTPVLQSTPLLNEFELKSDAGRGLKIAAVDPGGGERFG